VSRALAAPAADVAVAAARCSPGAGRRPAVATLERRHRSRSPRPALLLVVVAGLAALAAVAGCSDDGRELAEPAPDQTTTTPSTGPGQTVTTAGGMSLSSPAFPPGAPLPDWTACPNDVSPPLTWTGVPQGTVELALVVTDPDADDFVHWVVGGIDPSSTGVDQGAVPPGAVEARNSDGGTGWFGPCPPAGETHTYVFELRAYLEPVGLQPGLDADDAVKALAGAAVEARYTGTFTR
jgi:Raf kinase inhibitor-like YbhB/YbcL family protein